jgi:hypothetical protein
VDHPGVRLHPARRGLEVLTGGDAVPVERDEGGVEGARPVGDLRVHGQRGEDVPVLGAAERHPLPFALHDDAGRHRLHPAGRQPRHDLLPQHRRDLVAVQPVQDAARLLGVDQVPVDLAGVGYGRLDGRLGDLVEDHPLDRHLGLERLHQVPGDRLALAVLIRREQQLVGLADKLLQLGDLLAPVGRDDVERREPVVHIDTEPCPRLALVLGGHVGRVAWKVPNVAQARLHDVSRTEVTRDRLGLRR